MNNQIASKEAIEQILNNNYEEKNGIKKGCVLSQFEGQLKKHCDSVKICAASDAYLQLRRRMDNTIPRPYSSKPRPILLASPGAAWNFPNRGRLSA